jgi:hypothetical protein
MGWSKVAFFWALSHCGIQGNDYPDALAMDRSSSLFLGPEPAISISPCVSRLKVKEWLQERHSEHWTAAPGMRRSKHFIGRPSDKLSRDRMALDRKQYRLVTGF